MLHLAANCIEMNDAYDTDSAVNGTHNLTQKQRLINSKSGWWLQMFVIFQPEPYASDDWLR